MQLRISDGTTTVDLSGNSTGIYGCTYFPNVGADADPSVADTVELIGNGTEAQIRTAINNIENLLEGARRRARVGTGVRVFLEYRPVDTDTLYRCEVYDGRIVYDSDPGARRFVGTSLRIKYALLVDRSNWWESTTETELQLSANGQSAATGGRTVTNNGTANWLGIAAAQVTGTLPAPLRLQLANTSAAAKYYADIYIGNDAFGAPTADHYIQGENQISGYGTDAADANASGGNVVQVAITTTSTLLVAWLIPSALMAAAGRWYRLFMRSSYPATNTRIKPVIYDYYGLIKLWEGAETLLTNTAWELNDLGAIPIPPGAYATDYAQVRLAFWMRTDSANTMSIDYVAMLAQDDAFRQVHQLGMSVAVNDKLEIDEIDGRYTHIEGSSKHPILVPTGRPLVVYPGVTQRLHILERVGTGGSTIANTMSVRAYYRPRRRSI
jgi:hypothetical protein